MEEIAASISLAAGIFCSLRCRSGYQAELDSLAELNPFCSKRRSLICSEISESAFVRHSVPKIRKLRAESWTKFKNFCLTFASSRSSKGMIFSNGVYSLKSIGDISLVRLKEWSLATTKKLW